MYCQKCGAENPEIAIFCNKCGNDLKKISNTPISSSYNSQPVNSNESSSIGWNILSFLLPIVGLILYFIWKNTYPKKAGNVLVAAGVGFVFNLILLLM